MEHKRENFICQVVASVFQYSAADLLTPYNCEQQYSTLSFGLGWLFVYSSFSFQLPVLEMLIDYLLTGELTSD